MKSKNITNAPNVSISMRVSRCNHETLTTPERNLRGMLERMSLISRESIVLFDLETTSHHANIRRRFMRRNRDLNATKPKGHSPHLFHTTMCTTKRETTFSSRNPEPNPLEPILRHNLRPLLSVERGLAGPNVSLGGFDELGALEELPENEEADVDGDDDVPGSRSQ